MGSEVLLHLGTRTSRVPCRYRLQLLALPLSGPELVAAGPSHAAAGSAAVPAAAGLSNRGLTSPLSCTIGFGSHSPPNSHMGPPYSCMLFSWHRW
ncbi:hypothetical protein NN561_009661 [Cricetulus griseus]